jgi:hypothetical protein
LRLGAYSLAYFCPPRVSALPGKLPGAKLKTSSLVNLGIQKFFCSFSAPSAVCCLEFLLVPTGRKWQAICGGAGGSAPICRWGAASQPSAEPTPANVKEGLTPSSSKSTGRTKRSDTCCFGQAIKKRAFRLLLGPGGAEAQQHRGQAGVQTPR